MQVVTAALSYMLHVSCRRHTGLGLTVCGLSAISQRRTQRSSQPAVHVAGLATSQRGRTPCRHFYANRSARSGSFICLLLSMDTYWCNYTHPVHTTYRHTRSNIMPVHRCIITRSRECCKDDEKKSMGKGKIWPPASQKPLNRWSPKFVWVTTSVISTTMQNFIQIGSGVSVLRMRDFAPLGTKWLGYFGGYWERLQPRRV